MSKTPVRFYFDFLSPYAYLAWTELHQVARKHGRGVEPVPVLLAALLTANGSKGPAEIPNKRRWVIRDVMRWAKRLKLPLGIPPSHPFNPLLSLRLASLDMDHAERIHLIGVLFRAVWGGGDGVETEEALRPLLKEEDFDADDLLQRAQMPETKARLKANTQGALELGVFGVPTMLVDGELFWGFDSFRHIDRFLAGDDEIDEALVERWLGLPATAQRKQQ